MCDLLHWISHPMRMAASFGIGVFAGWVGSSITVADGWKVTTSLRVPHLVLAEASSSRSTVSATMGTVPKAYLTSMQHSKDEVAYAIRIDINKPILRLYRNGHMWRSYPVALGKPETQTPIGEWEIVDKQKDWGGGFGTRWLGLNVPWGTYGIHGTNRPAFIGTYASNGCIRMHNHDVEQLYDTVPLGTPVIITGNPLKYLRTLAYGHIGADVQQVQRQLKALGYFRGECDGRFDQATQFALELFELAHELPMNGVVDKEDYQALGLIE